MLFDLHPRGGSGLELILELYINNERSGTVIRTEEKMIAENSMLNSENGSECTYAMDYQSMSQVPH